MEQTNRSEVAQALGNVLEQHGPGLFYLELADWTGSALAERVVRLLTSNGRSITLDEVVAVRRYVSSVVYWNDERSNDLLQYVSKLIEKEDDNDEVHP